ncbi:hypothetical protein HCN73_06345 [Lactobacillus crispatus]|uniref:hypothetical protein n=1 Tax=Lactobacillus crispatus TaxID=47770 RepID=UPI0015EC2D41|nr:hypothetical protein [Lactobacillus crispatus]MBA2915953.1 hypothetical protein [Lactobacillus crispatus]
MKKRISKFELLRIIAMYLIVLHHAIVHGILDVSSSKELINPGKTSVATVLGMGGENRCFYFCNNYWIFYGKF